MHQLRNSFRFVPDKLLKDLANDLKTVYQAPNREQGLENLLIAQEKWGMYTTNTVEGYHRQLRKVTKTKGAFSSEVSLTVRQTE